MKKLQQWSLIAEIVAAIAVVLSIAYLTLEVQRNTSAVQSQTSQGLLEMANQANMELAANADMADVFVRGNKDLDVLTPSERLRYRRMINSEIGIWEHAFYSHANGTMDDRLWKGYDVSYRATFCIESARQIWNEIQTFFGDDFRAHVNSTTEAECDQTSF